VPKIAFCHCSKQIFLSTEFKCLCYSTAWHLEGDYSHEILCLS
jgi:hypothetical protein